ncbi:hypothetical protein COC54_30400 [Bacillus pseudomycoides]|nr:hypothetical protein COC54_30400 [Bacillus pseudomycoides]
MRERNLTPFLRFFFYLIEETYPKWKNREITGVQFMEVLGLKKNTFYKVIKEYENTLNVGD